MPEDVSSGEGGPALPQGSRSIQLTPELVEKITARVYALMLADARIERERHRIKNFKPLDPHGGRHAV